MTEIEDFHGCYLLYSLNPKCKGKTYIGYTVDPNKRIQQHNKGLKGGGAWKTNSGRPWDMVLIVHGFPNELSALRFEWAWQNPKKSRRLNHLPKKDRKESQLQYCFRIMSEMLRVGPWCRLPLTIRWLKEEYQIEFKPDKLPPPSMPIAYGAVKRRKLPSVKSSQEGNISPLLFDVCLLCCGEIKMDGKNLSCLNPSCQKMFHMLCLAEHFLNTSQQQTQKKHLLPVDGTCPKCSQQLLWGDLIRYYKGCYRDSQLLGIDDDDSEEHWSSQLRNSEDI